MVTSGVCSSLGKGVASAALGSLIEGSGLTVSMIKCDPYINIDAGNISPYQHGEVYVTEDGAETDLDLGNFSRFTSINITSDNCITIGKVYERVIQNERAGRYNGRTVQVIPHITDEIKRRILYIGSKTGADVVIVEIGGTVGDIESIPFLEAARQLIHELASEDICSVHLTLMPVITGGELKSKPTQHSVKQLQEAGIQPDVLLCRCEKKIDAPMRKKLALFCNVPSDAVFTSEDVEKTIYELPVLFHKQGIDAHILKKLALKVENTSVRQWSSFLSKLNNPACKVTVAMVGKKDYLDECFKSVKESLFHAAVTSFGAELVIKKIDAETLEESENPKSYFEGIDGIVIPGNYGQRGFLGLLYAVRLARENNIPYLGIDLGMQLMAIETARTLLDWKDADSTEFIQTSGHALISLPEEQGGLNAGGLMQLGAGTINIAKGSRLHSAYKKMSVVERHRNKYTFDRRYVADIEEKGLAMTAVSEMDMRAEAFEWTSCKWGVGVQFHPEFTSRPAKPHPLFTAFIGACLDSSKQQR